MFMRDVAAAAAKSFLAEDSSTTTGRPTTCFSLRAGHDSSVYPAVLGVLAKLGLTPFHLYGVAAGPGAEELHLDFQLQDLDAETARVLAHNLRRLILVETVLVCEKS